MYVQALMLTLCSSQVLLRILLINHNFNGMPTLSVPCGLNSERLPLSLQIVGKHLSEALLCQIGHAYETATEWHLMHPPED